MNTLTRTSIFPEKELPVAVDLIAEGWRLANTFQVGSSVFLAHYGVQSESEYKRRCMEKGQVMLHAQVGYRSLDKSRRAYAEIYENLVRTGYRVDRYGICLDWSMGYPTAKRSGMPKGTGLILEQPDDFARLTKEAPVAPHFGDFVIGTPAAVENTAAALIAGSTSIGNLGQYFTFRMPRWQDDIGTTAETVKAIALCAAQPVEVLVHSNLDDGFAALFTDMSCAIGAVLIERYIVDELIGGHASHCYGHTFSDPLTRLAFQRALVKVTDTPGTMVYGNTTIFVENEIENYANLGSYLLVDILAQRLRPSGHGINPVPVTEAMRIPEIDEIVNAHLFANRLIQRSTGYEALLDLQEVDQIADRLVEGGKRFKQQVLAGLENAGIDISSPFELLLAIRRIGAKWLEELFGPGQSREDQVRKRVPVVKATTVASLDSIADQVISLLDKADRERLMQAGWVACLTCTDVHEYGKLLVESVLNKLGIKVVDAGVSADPEVVARRSKEDRADFIAVSTYNGVALEYLKSLRQEMLNLDLSLPVFVGGKLNQIPLDSPDSLPVDISADLIELGIVVCHRVEDMLQELVRISTSQR